VKIPIPFIILGEPICILTVIELDKVVVFHGVFKWIYPFFLQICQFVSYHFHRGEDELFTVKFSPRHLMRYFIIPFFYGWILFSIPNPLNKGDATILVYDIFQYVIFQG